MLSILIVNGDRHLINEVSNAVDETCSNICSSYPDDATIEFEESNLWRQRSRG